MSDVYKLLQSLELREGQRTIIGTVPQNSADVFNDDGDPPIKNLSSIQPRHARESENAIVSYSSLEANRSSDFQGTRSNESPTESQINPYATTIELIRNTCGVNCNCKCHTSLRFRSPGVLDSIFGSLFLGYEASPWSSQRCQNARCRRSSTTVHYTFPRWFVTRIVAITMSYNQAGTGPELLLRVLQIRPNDARIFACAQHGHLEEAKRLLVDGEASIFDVNSYSCTALHVRFHARLPCSNLMQPLGCTWPWSIRDCRAIGACGCRQVSSGCGGNVCPL